MTIYHIIQLDSLCHFLAVGDRLLKMILEEALRRLQI